MENEAIINKRVCDFSKKTDIIQTVLIYLVAVLAPTFLGQLLKEIFPETSIVATKSQLIVGTIVNVALIMAALNLKGWKKILGVITMPSISTILSGYIFKTASTYMVFMIPAIWFGNLALVYSYKLIKLSKDKNFFLAGFVGVVVKVAIIFGIFNILKVVGVFPEKLVSTLGVAMGTTQAITATMGVLVASIIYKIEKK